MERWRGRVALVTGASGGIGSAICRRLVDAGLTVIGAAPDPHRIKALAEELTHKPGSLTAIKCDLTQDDDVLNMFASIKHKFGGVDVCVNNAGFSYNHSLLEGSPAEWREMLDVNVVGLCLCTREAVASMRERGVDHGQIIHISSASGHRVNTSPSTHFYGATKYAVRALTEGLRQELRDAKSHIRVASISPGGVKSEFFTRMLGSEELSQKAYTRYRYLDPDDVAASLVHILSAPPHVQIHDIIVRSTYQDY